MEDKVNRSSGSHPGIALETAKTNRRHPDDDLMEVLTSAVRHGCSGSRTARHDLCMPPGPDTGEGTGIERASPIIARQDRYRLRAAINVVDKQQSIKHGRRLLVCFTNPRRGGGEKLREGGGRVTIYNQTTIQVHLACHTRLKTILSAIGGYIRVSVIA